MGKFVSLFSMSMLTLLLVPVVAFAEEAGAEEAAAAEPSGLLLTFLTVMSLATIITMIFLCARDNG